MPWIEKKDPPHACMMPRVGDHFDVKFGDRSIWECDCGKRYIWIADPKWRWGNVGDWVNLAEWNKTKPRRWWKRDG